METTPSSRKWARLVPPSKLKSGEAGPAYFGGITGTSRCDGCFGPPCSVTRLPKISGGRSLGSLCWNGPTPVNTAPTVPSPPLGYS